MLKCCNNVLDTGFRRQLHIGAREAKPLGAQAHLSDRLFARNVDNAVSLPRQHRAGLNEQGGFADAGLAAQQHDGARNKAAAGDAVEFAHAGCDARSGWRLSGQTLQSEGAALQGCAGRHCANACGDALLHNAIPPLTGFAFALPAGRKRAAILANEAGARLGHGGYCDTLTLAGAVRM